MVKKVSRIIFIALFFLMIAVPLVATFFQHEEIAVEQNRMLEPPPRFYDRPGHINPSFTMDFEAWINDHIGFRSALVNLNGNARYYLAGTFSIDRPFIIGPNRELNYAGADALKDYQHKDLYSKDYLDKTADSLELLDRYAKENGAELYYYQCWDKPSIYPEYLPETILVYGEDSKTDGILKAFEEKPDLNVISPKQELIRMKASYDTYSRFGDPTHWTQRGAYIGYLELMSAFNENSKTPYKVLKEDDYDIQITDQGLTLYGSIHQEDLLERFEIRKANSVVTKEKLTLFADDSRSMFYTNEAVDNDSRLVIIGDSYFYYYILDDIAESFHETVFFWGDHLNDFKTIVDEYEPDIILLENAEREDRTGLIIDAAKQLN